MTIAQESDIAAKAALLDWTGPQAAVIFAGIVSLAWHAAIPLNHDVAWIWEGAQRLLDGGRFGQDVIDVNPPLAWWLTLVPVALSRLTGFPAAFSFAAFMVALGAAGILVSLRIVSRALDGSAWVIGLVAASTLFLVPGYDFGQREHIMAALALPYLCAASVRAGGQAVPGRLAWTAGILGGVGFCLKPHFLLVPLLVEIWLSLRTRRDIVIRPEPIALACIGVVYIAAVLLFAPGYLNRVVPDAAVGYGAYGAPIVVVALRLVPTLVPLLIGVGLVFVARPQGMRAALAQCFLVAAFGAVASYLIQSKGWDYQMLPALVFLGLAAGAAFPAPGPRRSLPAIVGLAMVILLGSRGALAQLEDADGTRARVAELSRALRTSANGKVFAFITSPRDIHPAIVESGTTWIGDAGGLYLLPAAVEAAGEPVTPRSRAAIAAGTRQAQAAISELIQSGPAIVAVDDKPTKLGFGTLRFSYLEYFLHDARFARYWRGYREEQPAGGFRIFRCSSECRVQQP